MSQYCDLADVRAQKVPAHILEEIGSEEFQSMCEERGSWIDGYLGAYVLPLLSWGKDLRSVAARLVAFDIMSPRVNPEEPTGAVWYSKRDEAQKWLLDLQRKAISPVGIVDSSAPPAPPAGGFVVSSDEPAGWGGFGR